MPWHVSFQQHSQMQRLMGGHATACPYTFYLSKVSESRSKRYVGNVSIRIRALNSVAIAMTDVFACCEGKRMVDLREKEVMEANNIRTSRRRKATKWDMPVSRKFYQRLMEQVESVCRCSPSLDVARMKMIITVYAQGAIYTHRVSEMEAVIIKLLRPLIEQAQKRSWRARLTANERQLARIRAERAAAAVATDTTTRSEAASADTLSSRREAAKERRRIKHLKRIARRQRDAAGTRPPTMEGVASPEKRTCHGMSIQTEKGGGIGG